LPGKPIRVHRVHCVIDCGVTVNPNLIRQQVESAIVYGLSAALRGEITIDKGQVHPLGVGELGTSPIAQAVANAVCALTGQRLRSLPLKVA
jgi:isoquinoline 1-oxidoreductase subunit beta